MNNLTNPPGKPGALYLGQIFIDQYGHYMRIYEINREKGTVRYEVRRSDGSWDHYSHDDIDDILHRKDWIPIQGTVEESEARALEVLHNLEESGDPDEEEDESEDTAIVSADSKATLERSIALIEERRQMIEQARRVIKRKTDQMNSMIHSMEKKIGKLRRVVQAFELYLGVYEDIVMIRDGQAAPVDTPISIRQLILWMDEEVGDPRPKVKGQRGIDWQSVEDFDDWILQGNHLDQVLPEPKGVVALRPSRQDRHYSNIPWFDILAKEKNKYAYLLIRNGEKVYRIWTGTFLGETLYPTQNEQEQIWKGLDPDLPWDREKVEDRLFVFKRNALILQGLIDRTEVFEPIPQRIALLDSKTYDSGLVRFVRDAEYTLPDGRKPFKEWQKEINSKLQPGSRVFVAVGAEYSYSYRSPKDYKRYYLTYSPNDNYPPLPEWGVYQLSLTDEPVRDYDEVPTGETYIDHWDKTEHMTYRSVAVMRRRLRIKYNPGDEVVYGSGWDWDPHPRKNKVSFLIDKDDKFIINVDMVDPEDIEFYLHNRVERVHYLSMIPLLWGIRDFVLAEREKEKDFVALVAHRLGVDEAQVWEAVSWWKFKNQWKRSIREDDAKALRMIEKRIGQSPKTP